MARVFEVSFKLGAQLAGSFAKTMQGASSSLTQLNSRIGELNKAEHATQSLIGLRKTVLDSTRAYRDARQKVADLGREISNTDQPSKTMIRNFERAEKEVSQAKNTLMSQREQLKQLNTTMGTTGTSTRELIKRQEELAQAADKARGAQSSLNKTMAAQQENMAKRGELRGQLFDAAGLAIAMAAPIKIAANFEQAMAKVGAVSNATDAEMGKLTATARQLGASTSWSASQAAEGMQFLAQAGFSTQQTMAAMPGMLDLASAGDTDLGSAADIASNILTGFNLKAEEMGRLGDVLTNTFTTSNTNISMLGETMKYVAPIAASTGVSLEQAAAMAGKLGDAGIQGSNAGTALRTVISRLSAPTAEAAAKLRELGVETQDASGNLRSVPDILAEMESAMSGMGTAARAELTSTIFGLEAASGATVLLGQAGSGSLQKYAEKLKETGTASRVAAKQNDTAMGAMRRLSSAAESIAITMGNILLPTLAAGAEMLSSVIGVVDNLAQNFPLLTSVVVGGTAALIALKVATIAGGYAFTFLKGAWRQGVAVLKTLRVAYLLSTGATIASTNASKAAIIVSKAMTAAQWLFNAAMTANPIGLVIVAIGALVAAGVLLYKNWDTVVAFFGAAWERMKSLLSNFNPLSWMMSGFSALTNWLDNFSLYDSGAKMLSTLSAGIKSAVSGPVDAVKGALSRVRDYLPFSDAKVGPLSELTASGQAILNTIGDGMGKVNVASMMTPLAGMGAAVDGLIPGKRDTMDAASGRITKSNSANGGVTLQLTQNITLGSGVGTEAASQAREGAAAGANDMLTALKQAMDQERRLSYD